MPSQSSARIGRIVMRGPIRVGWRSIEVCTAGFLASQDPDGHPGISGKSGRAIPDVDLEGCWPSSLSACELAGLIAGHQCSSQDLDDSFHGILRANVERRTETDDEVDVALQQAESFPVERPVEAVDKDRDDDRIAVSNDASRALSHGRTARSRSLRKRDEPAAIECFADLPDVVDVQWTLNVAIAVSPRAADEDRSREVEYPRPEAALVKRLERRDEPHVEVVAEPVDRRTSGACDRAVDAEHVHVVRQMIGDEEDAFRRQTDEVLAALGPQAIDDAEEQPRVNAEKHEHQSFHLGIRNWREVAGITVSASSGQGPDVLSTAAGILCSRRIPRHSLATISRLARWVPARAVKYPR